MLYNRDIFKRCFSHPVRYWYKNIKYIPLYFKLIHYLMKHGYDEYATWETFNWFIDTMKDILTYYRNHHTSYPVSNIALIDSGSEEWNEYCVKYDKDIDRMIVLLDTMDESNKRYEGVSHTERQSAMIKAKDEFFSLFAKHFYSLWD